MAGSDFDVIVLGGGISALSLAVELQKAGRRILVVNKPGGIGASGLPGGLANPAHGQQARLGWQAEECLNCLLELPLPEAGPGSPAPLRQNGILRPATSHGQAEVFRQAAERHNSPDGWMEWLDPAESAERFPLAASPCGSLWLPRGITMHIPSLLDGLKTQLIGSGTEFLEADEISVVEGSDKHTVIAGNLEARAPVVAFAAGAGITDYPRWSALKLNLVKGQVVEASLGRPGPDHSVASSGYSAFTGGVTVVTGSTYEHDFTTLAPDDAAGRRMLKRLGSHCPGLADRITETRNWAGVRVTTPDRRPWVGMHWETPGFYCITGMGSRGLLVAPLVARYLASHITEAKPLPGELDIQRLYKTRKWNTSS
jgi:glycine oxidase